MEGKRCLPSSTGFVKVACAGYKSFVTNLERRRLQFVHGATIFQVNIGSELELREAGASLQREAFVVLCGSTVGRSIWCLL